MARDLSAYTILFFQLGMSSSRTRIIAEVSANHNNSLQLAKQLIEEASRAGADFVKFQLYERFMDISSIPNVEYSGELIRQIADDSETISKYHLKEEWLPELLQHSRLNGIDIIYSCSSLRLIDLAKEFSSISILKIASCDATNLRLLAKASELFQEIIISTGALSLNEASLIHDFLRKSCNFAGRICFLYCVSRYPCRVEDVYLESIAEMKSLLDCQVGYSDHMPGINACVASLRYSPYYIEKHFTLKGIETVDSSVSCDGIGLRDIVNSARLPNGTDPNLMQKVANPMLQRSPYTDSVEDLIDINDVEFIRPGLGLGVEDAIKIINRGSFVPAEINNAWPWISQQQ